jgi:two-component system, cell cycle response regulator
MSTIAANIFVADDNPILLQGIGRALSAAGYAVHTANSGSALLELLDSSSAEPDLLLLDVMMPGMSGIDVLCELHRQSRWADLPIVLITAASDDTLPIAALQNGAVDFLTKPFRLGELMARIEAHVRRYRAIRQARAETVAQAGAMEVVRSLGAAQTPDELFLQAVRGVSALWRLRRCTIVVDDGPEMVCVAATSDDDPVAGRLLELRAYPEIRAALKSGEPVLVTDVAESPLFDAVRRDWHRDGIEEPLHSVAVLPFELPSDGTPAALFLRAAGDESRIDEQTLRIATSILEGVRQELERAHIAAGLAERHRLLEDVAHRDELTGCATRRALFRRLEADLKRARSTHRPLGLVLLDVDRFKQINDTHGHLAGDAVLRNVGNWLAREGNGAIGGYVGRYGGDEFIVVLPDVDIDGAYRFAEFARSGLSQLAHLVGGSPLQVTLSAGAASWPMASGGTVEDLLANADTALYQAKRAGRDCVRLALTMAAARTSQ